MELENLRGEHTRTLEEAKKEKVCYVPLPVLPNLLALQLVKLLTLCSSPQLLLTNQLEMEKMKVEQEKKKCYLAQEALKEKVRHFISTTIMVAIDLAECVFLFFSSF